ncbi:MAG: nucleotidyltransferase domain-containing protein [Nanoarchaeota archaeon]
MFKKIKIVSSRTISPIEYVDAYGKVQHIFFDFPTKEFGLNDLCALAKISKTSANLAVAQLVKEGFLKVETIGRLWRISCDQSHPYNRERKIPYHLSLVYSSGILDAVHKAVPGARSISLFGSIRKGDDIESSDIDIAVEVLSDKVPQIVELGTINKLGYRKDIPVNLHIFSRNNIPLNLFANIANGIVLEGFLEVRP